MGIRSEFDHVTMSDAGREKALRLREQFSTLLDSIEEVCGNGREAASARTNLQQSAYWAMKGLCAQAVNQALPKLLALFMLAFVFVSMPAFAQAAEPAPSIQAENWVQALMGFVFTGLLFPLGRRLVEWVAVQAQGKAYENAARAVTDLIGARAVWLHAKMQEAAADGKVTKEEVEAIAAELMAQLPAQTMKVLTEHLGSGVVAFIAGTLRDRVTARARADAAGAQAVAAINTLEAAKAAWKVPAP